MAHNARLAGLRQTEAKALSWFLAGAATVADWVGSNTARFSSAHPDLLLDDYLATARGRARAAVAAARLQPPAHRYEALFDFALRLLQ